MSSLLGSGNLLGPWHLRLYSGYTQFPLPNGYRPPFKWLSLCSSSPSPPISEPEPPLPPTLLSLPDPSLLLLPNILFFPLLSRTVAFTLLCDLPSSSVSRGLLVVLWAFHAFLTNFHLSITTYHVYPFVTRIPHSGWYFNFQTLAFEFHEVMFLKAE